MSFVKVELVAELLYLITLDRTSVPNEVASECRYTHQQLGVNQLNQSFKLETTKLSVRVK